MEKYRAIWGEPFHPHDHYNSKECWIEYKSKSGEKHTENLKKHNDYWILDEWKGKSFSYPIAGSICWKYDSGLEAYIDCLVLPHPSI